MISAREKNDDPSFFRTRGIARDFQREARCAYKQRCCLTSSFYDADAHLAKKHTPSPRVRGETPLNKQNLLVICRLLASAATAMVSPLRAPSTSDIEFFHGAKSRKATPVKIEAALCIKRMRKIYHRAHTATRTRTVRDYRRERRVRDGNAFFHVRVFAVRSPGNR